MKKKNYTHTKSPHKKDKEDHSYYLAQAFMDLLDKIGNTSISFIASAFLYNWVRLTTIASDLDEEYFQNLERKWDIVFDYIYKNECSAFAKNDIL